MESPCSTATLYAIASELNVLFHSSPAEHDNVLQAHIELAQALWGCQHYSVTRNAHPGVHLTIKGIWDNRHARLAYYQGAELQTLITLLIRSGAVFMEFEECVSTLRVPGTATGTPESTGYSRRLYSFHP